MDNFIFILILLPKRIVVYRFQEVVAVAYTVIHHALQMYMC